MRMLTDFDVDVSAVLLAHRYTIRPETDMDTYRHGRHMHGMVCAISGGLEYHFDNGEMIRLMPGEIALISSDSAYRIKTADDRPCEHYTVNFLGNADTFPKWMSPAKICVLHPKDPAMYLARLDELIEGWKRMRTGYRMQTKAKLLSLLADFLTESMTQTVDPGAYNRTLPAKRMIETHFHEPLSIVQMAEACDMCEGSFRRVFASVYNQSPVQYLLNLRIEKAKELLLLGLSLDEAAQKTGFTDVNYFIRYFHKTTGMTPGTFRKRY